MAGKVISNLEQLAEAIGSYVGMLEGLDQQEYMDGLIGQAHSEVAFEFDKHAAAQAMQDRSLSHMWEYGTAGVSPRGRIKYANPLNPKAKLWTHTIVSRGRVKTFGFTILPAKSLVPPHDLQEIEVAPRDMPPLKLETGKWRYKFPNKASLYESGMTVNLAPKRAKALFIPIKTEGLPAKYTGDTSKGFVWAQRHTYSPGDMADATGRFTGMFGAYWAGMGGDLLSTKMMIKVERDLLTVSSGVRPSKTMNSAARASIAAAAKRGRTKTRKQWTIKTRPEIGARAGVIL